MTTDAPPHTGLGPDLAQDFRRLWFARAASDAGTAIAMGALPLIAIRVLDASTFQVSLLTAAAGLVGAAFALPLSPAREARRKRPVMIAADLVRALLFLSVPLAHAMDVLAFWHLVVVSGVAALGGVVFGGASAAHLKNLVPTEHRTEALSKLESTFWLFNTVGPALGIRRIRRPEPTPPPRGSRHPLTEASAGFTLALGHPTLRPLLVNSTLFAAFVAWIGPLELVLLLRGLALPNLGGLVGSWLAPRVSRRLGGHRTLVTSGLLRGLPLFALPFLPEGVAGLVIYVVATFLLLVAAGVFRPVYSALRMDATDDAHMMRVTTAFTLAARGAGPLFALLAGVLATWIGVRGALMVGVIGLLVSGLFLPWRNRSLDPSAPRTAPAR